VDLYCALHLKNHTPNVSDRTLTHWNKSHEVWLYENSTICSV